MVSNASLVEIGIYNAGHEAKINNVAIISVNKLNKVNKQRPNKMSLLRKIYIFDTMRSTKNALNLTNFN